MGFQKISSLSLTDLFVQQIENMILSGELAVGEQLPPARGSFDPHGCKQACHQCRADRA